MRSYYIEKSFAVHLSDIKEVRDGPVTEKFDKAFKNLDVEVLNN